MGMGMVRVTGRGPNELRPETVLGRIQHGLKGMAPSTCWSRTPPAMSDRSMLVSSQSARALAIMRAMTRRAASALAALTLLVAISGAVGYTIGYGAGAGPRVTDIRTFRNVPVWVGD